MTWLIWFARMLVSRAVLGKALDIVRQAAEVALDNPTRRAWAINQLMNHGVSENMARLAVELAVAELKRR